MFALILRVSLHPARNCINAVSSFQNIRRHCASGGSVCDPGDADIVDAANATQYQFTPEAGCRRSEASINRFRFFFSLSRELSPEAYIKSITFNLGRWGSNRKTIEFEELQTELKAIRKVEKYLSTKFTKRHYDMLVRADDLYSDIFDDYSAGCKGNALGDAVFLESLDPINGDRSHVSIFCGS
jgi:hypothetical protein